MSIRMTDHQGPLHGSEDAPGIQEEGLELRRRRGGNFLPGPVRFHPEVLESLGNDPLSHREEAFQKQAVDLRLKLERLAKLVRLAPESQIAQTKRDDASTLSLALGSGTLANEMIAARLKSESRRAGTSSHQGPNRGQGLILVNGEFGRRLSEQARRWELQAHIVESPWGQDLDYEKARRHLRQQGASWIWAVLCETSTGAWNDLEELRHLAREAEAQLCIDAVSALGAEPVDLRGVDFASGSSGKALGGPAGLALVFHPERATPLEPRHDIPAYLDLGLYSGREPPFTTNTPLARALDLALHLAATGRSISMDERARRGRWLRSALVERGWPVLGSEVQRPALAVVTLPLPASVSASALADRMWNRGFAISHRSAYLESRNWVQICLMGYRHDEGEVVALINALGDMGVMGDVDDPKAIKAAPGR